MRDRIILTDSFIGCLDKLDKHIRALALKTFHLLGKNPNHPSLHTEKIYDDMYTARVDINYRVVHQLVADRIRLIYIGKHDDVYRFIDRCRHGTVMQIRENPGGRLIGKYLSKELPYNETGTISYRFITMLLTETLNRKWVYVTDNTGEVISYVTLSAKSKYTIRTRRRGKGLILIQGAEQGTRMQLGKHYYRRMIKRDEKKK